MKKILFYCCLLTTKIGISQNIKVVEYKNEIGYHDNTYAICNDLDKFIGEWVYTNNNEVFKITLVKVKLDNSKVFKAGVNSFMDAMVFYYDYRKNNKIILSNYDSLKKFKPTPTVGNIFNDNVFTCFGSKGENPNKLKCFIKDVPKKHGNQLHLIFNKDLNTLTSKNTSGSGGISIYFNESDKPLDGFTFPDNMTLKKVK